MKKILVADSSSVVRSIERQIISRSSHFEYGGEACTLSEIREGIKKYNCSGLLVDYTVIAEKKNIVSLNSVYTECRAFGVPVVLFVPKELLKGNSPDGIALLEKPSFTSLTEAEIGEYVSKLDNLLTVLSHDIMFKSNTEPVVKKEILPETKTGKIEAVLIGVSTGGPVALQTLLKGIGSGFDVPIFITQHVDAMFDKKLISWLDSNVALKIKLAEDYEVPQKNHVYFAPADKHLGFKRDKNNQVFISLNNDPPVNFLKPSIDKMFESASEVYRNPGQDF